MQDIRSKSKASKDVLDKRKKMHDDFNAYRQKVAKIWESQKKQRLGLRNSKYTFMSKQLQHHWLYPLDGSTVAMHLFEVTFASSKDRELVQRCWTSNGLIGYKHAKYCIVLQCLWTLVVWWGNDRNYWLNYLSIIVDIDTDELESHTENYEEETIEFLVKVEETVLESVQE